MAAQCLAALDVPCSAAGVAGLLADLLDGWLVDDADLAATRDELHAGAAADARPPVLLGTDLLMRDVRRCRPARRARRSPWRCRLSGARG